MSAEKTERSDEEDEDPRFYPHHCYPKREEGESFDQYMFRCHMFEQCWARLPGDQPIPMEFRPLAILNGANPSWTPVPSPSSSPVKKRGKKEEEDVTENNDTEYRAYWKMAAEKSQQMYDALEKQRKQKGEEAKTTA